MAPIRNENSTFDEIPIVTEDSYFGLDESMFYLIGGCAAAAGLLVIFCLCCCCCCCVFGRNFGKAKGREAAKAVIQQSADLTLQQVAEVHPLLVYHVMTNKHPNQIKTEDFKREVEKLRRMKKDEVSAYMTSIRYKKPKAPDGDVELQRVYQGEFVVDELNDKDRREKLLHPKYELLETSQAPIVGQHINQKDHQCLHASILHDVFGDEILISQAPSKDLFDFHWEMIWQRNVGVVIWLGPVGLLGRCIHPYINLGLGTQKMYGRFDVKTIKIESYRRYYTMFNISVRNTSVFSTVDFKEQENRELFFVHINPWPEKEKQVSNGDVAILVDMVRSLKLQQAKKGAPGILIHCSTGLESSAAFFSIYVSRQMQIRYNAVNVQAVMRFAERMRFNCFSSDAAFKHVQVVHEVLLEFISKFPPPAISKIKKLDETLLEIDGPLLEYGMRKRENCAKKPSSSPASVKPPAKSMMKSVLGGPKSMMAPKSTIGPVKSIIGNRTAISVKTALPIGPLEPRSLTRAL